MVGQREMSVLLRNGAPEKFRLMFRDGLLVLDDVPVEVEPVHDWCLRQSGWFSVQDAINTFPGMNPKTVRKRLSHLCQTKVLSFRTVVRNKREYRANVKSGGSQNTHAAADFPQFPI